MNRMMSEQIYVDKHDWWFCISNLPPQQPRGERLGGDLCKDLPSIDRGYCEALQNPIVGDNGGQRVETSQLAMYEYTGPDHLPNRDNETGSNHNIF